MQFFFQYLCSILIHYFICRECMLLFLLSFFFICMAFFSLFHLFFHVCNDFQLFSCAFSQFCIPMLLFSLVFLSFFLHFVSICHAVHTIPNTLQWFHFLTISITHSTSSSITPPTTPLFHKVFHHFHNQKLPTPPQHYDAFHNYLLHH